MSPRSAGSIAAVLALIADQAHKLWMLQVFDIRSRQPVHAGPFLDLVLVWNPGISYSLLRMDTPAGRWGLAAFVAVATAFLGWLMWRAGNKWLGVGLGLIVGGALGNLIDRLAYGAVADFFHLFIETERWGRLSWYVFNIADVAIVAGVALLLYEAFFVAQNSEPEAVPEQKRSDGRAGETKNGEPATKSPETGGT
jgi:signal peptidase II